MIRALIKDPASIAEIHLFNGQGEVTTFGWQEPEYRFACLFADAFSISLSDSTEHLTELAASNGFELVEEGVVRRPRR